MLVACYMECVLHPTRPPAVFAGGNLCAYPCASASDLVSAGTSASRFVTRGRRSRSADANACSVRSVFKLFRPGMSIISLG